MKLKDILSNISYEKIYNEKDIEVDSFSTDSRNIKENDCFIALKGENFDGNSFILDVLNKKASLVIASSDIREDAISFGIPIIVVKDGIKALQELAIYKRSLYNIPVVAITGSVGKTSTKDIISSVLNEEYNVLKTEGNFNNHIGLPLTILKLKNHTAMVLEMGMNHFHELELLSSIAKPTLAVITNVGTAHIGILGSRENILKAKLEILTGLNGKVVINNDNDLLNEWNKSNDKYDVVTYGIKKENDYFPEDINFFEDYSTFKYNNEIINVPVSGEHFVYNAMCAIAVARTLGIDITKIKNGIAKFSLSKNRMEIIKGKYTIIDDTYNANYDSMTSALKYLNELDGRKVAVVGTMLELGEFSREIHSNVGKFINLLNLDILIVVGEEAKIIYDIANIEKYYFNNNEDAIKFINEIKKDNDKILFKASNGMHFKEIVDAVK